MERWRSAVDAGRVSMSCARSDQALGARGAGLAALGLVATLSCHFAPRSAGLGRRWRLQQTGSVRAVQKTSERRRPHPALPQALLTHTGAISACRPTSMAAQMTAANQRVQRPAGCVCNARLAAPRAAAALLPLRRRQQQRRRVQPTRAAMLEVAQLAGEAGRAYDGSIWVTAASSVGLGECACRSGGSACEGGSAREAASRRRRKLPGPAGLADVCGCALHPLQWWRRWGWRPWGPPCWRSASPRG